MAERPYNIRARLNIERVSFYSFRWSVACVDFDLNGSTEATDVTFEFWPPDAPGPRKWPPFFVKGPIPVGASQDDNRIGNSGSSWEGDCTASFGSGAFVRKVDFADDSTWSAPANAPSGSVSQWTPYSFPTPFANPSPLPTLQTTASAQSAGNASQGTVFQYPTSGIRVTSLKFTLAYSTSQLNKGESYHDACVAFLNNGRESVSSVALEFLPKQFSDNPGLTANETIRPGASPLSTPCALTSGRTIAVSMVVYADGSVWTAPLNAPQGSQIDPP